MAAFLLGEECPQFFSEGKATKFAMQQASRSVAAH
jgi:hypothetical protein